jgi:uncharacterized membrane protein YqjE
MESAAAKSSSVLTAASSLLENVLASVRNRIQIFSIELQEEKIRAIQLLVWVAAMVFAGMMTLAFASLTVIYFFWENARLAALGGMTVFYAIGLIVLWKKLQTYLARQPKPFEATLSELEKDRACIRPTT